MFISAASASKQVSYSVLLNGYDEYIDFGNNFNFERTDPFTLSCWFKSNGTNGSVLFSKNEPESGGFNGKGYHLSPQPNGTLYFKLNNHQLNNKIEVITTKGGWVDDQWHQVVVTYTGSSDVSGLKIYVDNNDLALTTITNNLTLSTIVSNSFKVGKFSDTVGAGSYPYSGNIAQIAIYDKALSAGEVSTIYANRTVPNLTVVGPIANLIGYWPITAFDTSSSIDDASSGNHNGTPTNMAASNFLPVKQSDLIIQSIVGYSIVTDGTNEYVNCTSSSVFNFDRTSPFSSIAWVCPTGINAYIVGRHDFSNVGWGWGLLDTILFINLLSSGLNKISVESVGELTLGRWSHVAVTYDGSSTANGINFYIDGVLQSKTISYDALSNPMTTTTPLLIGARSGPSDFFKGYMSQIAVYDKELTGSEMVSIYNNRSISDLTVTGPTANLVGYWPIQSTDTTALINDASSNANNGTATNMEATDFVKVNQLNLFKTPIGSALAVDGTNEYVTMGDVLDFERTDSFTLACWYRGTSTNGYLISKVVSGSIAGYAIQCNASNGFDFFLNNTGTTNSLLIRTATTINDNLWHHITATYGGTSNPAGVILYVDGIAVAMSTIVNNLSATTLTVGQLNLCSRSNGGAGLLAGNIAQCSIYNKALSAEEVWTIYNLKEFCDLTRVGPFGNLVGYWPIQSSDTNTLIHDSSSGGNNGTAVNIESSDIYTVYDIR